MATTKHHPENLTSSNARNCDKPIFSNVHAMPSTKDFVTPKDRGYSWIIMAACFMVYALLMGTIKTFGILYAELLNTFHGGAGNTASIGSTCIFIQSMLGPLANALSMRYSFRVVSFMGGIFMSLGFFISAFMENMQMLYLTYSFIIGIGYGLTYAPCTTILNFYFENNRALANGIMLSASGIGGFIFPFLYQYLIDEYGLHGCMIVLSGIMLNSCVAATLFRQPMEFKMYSNCCENTIEQTDEENISIGEKVPPVPNKCGYFWETFKCIFTFRWNLFQYPAFACATLAFSLAATGYSSNFFILPVLIEDKGFHKSDAAFTMSIIGMFEVVARVFFGWFTDRKIIPAKLIFSASMLVSSVCAFSVPFLHRLEYLYGYAAVVGTFPGSLYTLLPIITIDIVGLQNLPAALGLVTVVTALISGIGQPSLGWLEDLTGSWTYSYLSAATILLLSSGIMLVIHMCSRKAKDVESTAGQGEIKFIEEQIQEKELFLEKKS